MSYAVITGGSKGIGKEIAIELASRGYDLLIAARNSYELQMVKEDIERKYQRKVQYLAIDLGLEGSSDKLFQWVLEQEVDVRILVNNAGYGLVGAFEQYELNQHMKMLQVNVNAVVELCHKFYPVLSGKGKSYILNIASSTAYQAIPLMSLYAASKVFVLNFSRGLHHEWKKKGISVTAVSPGATDTNFNDRANLQEKARKAAQKVTMTPEEVALMSVKGMFAEKPEVITGFINKLGAALAWVAPKKISEKVAMGIYE
ncbi:MAG: hypothetical protein RI995_219 [Bacteroidota bacterium]|jgi:short-subunit dehydrogenase